jgi:phosphotransferase system  glucose/maltose/N-acetylglucosamine-specific IIC component
MGSQDFVFKLCCALFAVVAILALLAILHGIALITFALLPVALFVFWLLMLVDCLLYEPSQGSGKIVWTIVIVALNVLGALLYFFIERPRLRAHRR